MAEQRSDLLVWIDLEMTGLEIDNQIIEIATIITDGDLNVIAEGPNIAIYQPDRILQGMDEWNTRTHTQSGLVKRIKESKITSEKAEQMTLTFIETYCRKNSAPLCGNSVGHDKTFLTRSMPSIVDYLNYRIVDVSSFKHMLKAWVPGFKQYEKKELHKALDDIKESIGELKYYKENFIKVPPGQEEPPAED